MSFIDNVQEAIEQVETRLNHIFSEVRYEKMENKIQKPRIDNGIKTVIDDNSKMVYKYIDDYGHIRDWSSYNYEIYEYE